MVGRAMVGRAMVSRAVVGRAMVSRAMVSRMAGDGGRWREGVRACAQSSAYLLRPYLLREGLRPVVACEG